MVHGRVTARAAVIAYIKSSGKKRKKNCRCQESNLGLLGHNELYSPLYYTGGDCAGGN